MMSQPLGKPLGKNFLSAENLAEMRIRHIELILQGREDTLTVWQKFRAGQVIPVNLKVKRSDGQGEGEETAAQEGLRWIVL